LAPTLRPITRRHLIGLATTLFAAGCAAPALVSRDKTRDPFEGGIGGTGIVGTLTEFGSLRINGLRAEVAARTRVVTALGPVGQGALVSGQSLTVFADRTPDALLVRHVRIDYPLVGRLEESGGRMRVNGVPVVPEPGAIRSTTPDRRVAVSGIWSGQGVVASRIDPAPFEADLVAGDVLRGADGAFSVGGVAIRGRGARSFPANGSYAIALGAFDGGSIVAERLSTGRFAFGSASLRQLSVEGYLAPTVAAPGFRIAGLGHSFADDLRLAQLAGQRAIFNGPYEGVFAARAGYVVPKDAAARRRLLLDGFDGALGDRAIPTV